MYLKLFLFQGPAFDGLLGFLGKNPQDAAKNVACINTSSDKGSTKYNCHQNFRMGKCGESQPAAGPYPLGSHGLCPYFYNLAFDHRFVPANLENCISLNRANISSFDVRMGYLGNYDKNFVRGDIFIATAASPPYVVSRHFVENTMMDEPNKDLLSWFLGIIFNPIVFPFEYFNKISFGSSWKALPGNYFRMCSRFRLKASPWRYRHWHTDDLKLVSNVTFVLISKILLPRFFCHSGLWTSLRHGFADIFQ